MGASLIQIVDTNILVRYLVGDVVSQQKQAENWFKEAEKGKRKCIIHPIVIAETVFVLESFYKKNREDIANAMEVFLSQKWLQVEQRDVLINLWPFYRKNLHFVDSFLLSYQHTYDVEVLTFDKQINKK